MTSINKRALAVGMIISLLSLSVYAQSGRSALNHFSTEGISFDYPAGYSVADESTEDAQQFVITRRGSSVQVRIVVMRRMVQSNEMPAAIESFKEPIIKKAWTTLGSADSPEPAPIQTEFGARPAEGIRLRSLGNKERTADVIWLRWSSRLVAATFIRSDVDEPIELRLWQTVRSSLKIEGPVIVGQATGAVPSRYGAPISGGVLNGKALELPKPAYPDIARAAHASGTVVVQVLIDEDGNVISAHAVSGHPLLQAASVAAAREAKFSPTKLAGQPVKVTGVIQYNFIAQ
jgi:TonB family protein